MSSISPEGTKENSSAFHRGAKVLNTSPFYAEAGGQVGDLGLLTNAAGAGMGWKLGGMGGRYSAIFWDFHWEHSDKPWDLEGTTKISLKSIK